MNTFSVVISIIASAILFACAPQAELVKTKTEMNDLRAELRSVKTQVQEFTDLHKRLDAIDSRLAGLADRRGELERQLSDAQKSMADQGSRFDQLTMDIQLVQGKLEENNFRIKELAQKLDDKAYKIAELSTRVEDLEKKIKALTEGTVSTTTGTAEKRSEFKMPEPSEAYRQAKTDYDRGNYDLAIAGFRNYIAQFPDASQVDSAQYWIGECYYSKKDYDKAIDEFQKVLKSHPKSEKAAGARLKIGYSYMNDKNFAKAKEHLNRVIKDYPNTREADLAKEKLKKVQP